VKASRRNASLTLRESEHSVRAPDGQPVPHEPRLHAAAAGRIERGRRIAGGQRGDDPSARPAVRVLEPLRAAAAAPLDRPAPRIALELFVSPLAQRWLQRTGPISYEYTDTLVDYALHGLAPR